MKKRTKQTNKTLSSTSLKGELWDTLLQVKAGALDVKIANAVANQSRSILAVIKTEMSLAQMSRRKVTQRATKFIKG